ncbi:MAG: hypothetical protein NDF55_06270 [archaeon GB-1867-005]|nr:hypothetical protein [Candidatus Culexmicrobium cathedralense]
MRAVVSHVILICALIASLSAYLVGIESFVNSHLPFRFSAEACINLILESILAAESSARTIGELSYIAIALRLPRLAVGGAVELLDNGVLRLELGGKTFYVMVPKTMDVSFRHSLVYVSEPLIWIVAERCNGAVVISIVGCRANSTRP